MWTYEEIGAECVECHFPAVNDWGDIIDHESASNMADGSNLEEMSVSAAKVGDLISIPMQRE
jgi:hypothetical protein